MKWWGQRIAETFGDQMSPFSRQSPVFGSLSRFVIVIGSLLLHPHSVLYMYCKVWMQAMLGRDAFASSHKLISPHQCLQTRGKKTDMEPVGELGGEIDLSFRKYRSCEALFIWLHGERNQTAEKKWLWMAAVSARTGEREKTIKLFIRIKLPRTMSINITRPVLVWLQHHNGLTRPPA